MQTYNKINKEEAEYIKLMKIKGCSDKAISEDIGCSENDVAYVCYDAAMSLKEDHSCAPWS